MTKRYPDDNYVNMWFEPGAEVPVDGLYGAGVKDGGCDGIHYRLKRGERFPAPKRQGHQFWLVISEEMEAAVNARG